MRVLHFGNVANNAYYNARILSAYGIENHVCAHDFYHVASSPEAFGDDVDVTQLADEWFPNWWSLGRPLTNRPKNVAQGPTPNVIAYLALLCDGMTDLADVAWRCMFYQRFKATISKNMFPQNDPWTETEFEAAIAQHAPSLSTEGVSELRTGRLGDELFLRWRAAALRLYPLDAIRSLAPPFPVGYLDAFFALDPDFEQYIMRHRDQGLTVASGFELAPIIHAQPPHKPGSVTDADWAAVETWLPAWRSLFDRYDAVIAYAQGPWVAWLSGYKPYIGYEIGTIRSLPFDESIFGRLTKAAYQNAQAVFITNADYLTAERKLEFEPEQLNFVPHALDTNAVAQVKGRFRPRVLSAHCEFFAPARLDWVTQDPQWSKNNHWIIHAVKAIVDSGYKNFHVLMVQWGKDVAATRDLVAELGVERYIKWSGLLSKRDLWARYKTSQAVLDQFLVGAMSGVAFEAMASGARVITRDEGANRRFFGSQPPLLVANSQAELVDQMWSVLIDPLDIRRRGVAAKKWMREYHSEDRIARIELDALRRVTAAHPSGRHHVPAYRPAAAIMPVSTGVAGRPQRASATEFGIANSDIPSDGRVPEDLGLGAFVTDYGTDAMIGASGSPSDVLDELPPRAPSHTGFTAAPIEYNVELMVGRLGEAPSPYVRPRRRRFDHEAACTMRFPYLGTSVGENRDLNRLIETTSELSCRLTHAPELVLPSLPYGHGAVIDGALPAPIWSADETESSAVVSVEGAIGSSDVLDLSIWLSDHSNSIWEARVPLAVLMQPTWRGTTSVGLAAPPTLTNPPSVQVRMPISAIEIVLASRLQHAALMALLRRTATSGSPADAVLLFAKAAQLLRWSDGASVASMQLCTWLQAVGIPARLVLGSCVSSPTQVLRFGVEWWDGAAWSLCDVSAGALLDLSAEDAAWIPPEQCPDPSYPESWWVRFYRGPGESEYHFSLNIDDAGPSMTALNAMWDDDIDQITLPSCELNARLLRPATPPAAQDPWLSLGDLDEIAWLSSANHRAVVG